MFEATLEECSIFKKIVESIKDLVNDVNVETSPTGSLGISTSRDLAPGHGQLTCGAGVVESAGGGL
jgi:hypothetical protein